MTEICPTIADPTGHHSHDRCCLHRFCVPKLPRPLTAAEARIKADAAADSIKTLGAANEELRTEVRAQNKALSAAEQRAAVAEERAKNRDEQLGETRAAAAKSEATAQDLQTRLNDTEKKLSVAERDLAVCRDQHQRGGDGGGGSGGGQGGGSGPEGSRQEAAKSRAHGDADKNRSGGKSETSSLQRAPETALMRSLGKPATPEERERSIERLQHAAGIFKHDLHRGETRYPRAATNLAPEATEGLP